MIRVRVAAAVLVAILAMRGPVRSAAAPAWATAVVPSGHEYALEVAADEASRQRGYMFRDRVGPREGMLFVFDASGRHGFWMKNCRVELDIVWLDEALRVIHMEHALKPCSEGRRCPVWEPLRPARYVLEFAAGTAREEGLRLGDPIVILSEPALR